MERMESVAVNVCYMMQTVVVGASQNLFGQRLKKEKKMMSACDAHGTCGRAPRIWPSRVGRRGLLAPRNCDWQPRAAQRGVADSVG